MRLLNVNVRSPSSGNTDKDTSVNRQLSQNITDAMATIMATSRTRSTEPKTMKSHSRSVSLVTRVIRLPVRRLAKKRRLSSCKWA